MSDYTSQGSISVHISQKVASITFFHPQRNSFPTSLLNELTQTIETLDHNNEVNVLVLKSSGPTFCAGASFDELLAIHDIETGQKFFSGFARVINAMRRSKKMILGRVQGKAVGGGVGLMAACDLVYALPETSVKLSEIAIGIGPFVIEPALTRKMGATAVHELSLHPNEWRSAAWALQKGLITKIAPDETTLDLWVEEQSNAWASYNPEALQALKKVFWEGTAHWDSLLFERAAISGTLVLSDFTRNALQNFKNAK